MQSGQYDKDCTTWSPQGTIPQISNACQAVNQGTMVLGLRSKTHAILAAFKKRQHQDFAMYDKKLFKIDDHCGIAIAGLTADARVLSDFMRMECLNHKYVYESPMKIGRLVAKIGDKAQKKTMEVGKRPYGVGLLISSHDELGAHIYETSPSGDYYEYVAFAIGNRANSAKTYLERNYKDFADLSVNELIKHAVKAVSVTTEQDVELTVQNMDLSIVGADCGYKKLSEEELAPLVEAVKADAPAAMDVDGGDGA